VFRVFLILVYTSNDGYITNTEQNTSSITTIHK